MSSSTNTGIFKAIQIHKIYKSMNEGIDNLQLVELPRPTLGDDEVRVRVHASALNYFDLLMLLGRYQYRPPLPFTVGSECSGEIIEVGANVKDWKVGQAVIAGMTMGNAMASEIVVPGDKLIMKPAHFTHSEAAGLPVGFFTTYHALIHRGNVRRGETLLVTGAGGGMGLSAVQLGVKLGMTVIAAASSDEKCSQAKKAGAHHTINYSNLKQLKERVNEITNGKYADVIYEVVGGDVFKECIRCIAPNGRLLVIGFASGSIPTVPVNMVLVKGFSLVGVRSGQEVSNNMHGDDAGILEGIRTTNAFHSFLLTVFQMFDHPELTVEMVNAMNQISSDSKKDRTLAPVVANIPVDQFREAYKLINERKVVGKACVLWQPETKAKL